jgi:hypothetical protein
VTRPDFPQPDDASVLAWRYLDLPKLLSLLMKKELHLTRLDSLEDNYEGTLPVQTREAMLAELRPTMSSKKAWPMIEKSISFLRKLQTTAAAKEFAERYANATADDAQGTFAATFGILMLFVVLQLTRTSRAAALAALEARNENPELQAKLDDSDFYEKLSESIGVLPGNRILAELEASYEPIPPENREAALSELADWQLMQFASIRQQLFVSCWHLGNHESEAMWRIYCGREDGVAIVLPYSRLRDSIAEANTFIGAVSYIPYETVLLKGFGTFSLAMHKRKEFEHENEARIVQQRIPAATPGQVHTSIQMNWDPEARIERIVISPYSRHWYRDIVKGLVERIAPGLAVKVVESSMSKPPFLPGSSKDTGN